MSHPPLLDWTVIIYVAAPDESLLAPALLLPGTLQKIGSSDKVHIVLQIDTSPLNAIRYFINVAGEVPPLVDQQIPKVQNTGSVEAFLDFVSWVSENHRANRYLVIFNGHGQGVQDFPGDESGNELENLAVAAVPQGFLNTPAIAAASSRLLVGAGAASLLNDQNPQDSLTNRELRDALAQACEALKVDHIDIVGFDACLMSMVEVAMQIHQSATWMVGSEQTIPSNGWPYPAIIKRLIDNPVIEPRPLGDLIVEEYLKFYGTPPDKEQAATDIEKLSAALPVDLHQQIVKRLETFEKDLKTNENLMLAVCDLTQSLKLSDAIGNLIPHLRQCLAIPGLRLAVLKARFESLFFFVSDFVDLFSFCSRVKDTLDTKPFATVSESNATLCQNVKTACQGVMDAIQNKIDKTGFVAKSEVTFPGQSDIRNASGVSIYFPLMLPLYRELEFSKKTLWDDFLQDYMTQFFLQPGSTPVVNSLSTLSVDGNGSRPKGGNNTMSSNPVSAAAAARTPCLVLGPGTKITDKATGLMKELTGLSYVDMTPEAKVHVPVDTDVILPGQPGVKAITGTEVKAISGTELKAGVGQTAKPLLEMVVPACTLRELTTANAPTDFADGTSIVAIKDNPIIVVNPVLVGAPLP